MFRLHASVLVRMRLATHSVCYARGTAAQDVPHGVLSTEHVSRLVVRGDGGAAGRAAAGCDTFPRLQPRLISNSTAGAIRCSRAGLG